MAPGRSAAETDSRQAARRASKARQFLNWYLLTLWRDRVPAIDVTRSRPYHKKDNARIEQKNRTHVRELLGEDRLDDPSLAALLIELHTVWSDFHNRFLPTLKLLKKERVAGQLRKTYERQARTPCARLLEDGHLAGAVRIALVDRRSGPDPIRHQSPRRTPPWRTMAAAGHLC